jgi:ATP-binding cassette subfamily B protein
MSATAFGTANEDNAHLSKSDSRAVRRRSLALLRSLIRPVRLRFWMTIAMVVLSQAARVAGPALIAFGIDRALPALQAGDNTPLVLTGVAYLLAAIATAGLTALYVTSTAKLSQAMLLDLRLRVFRHTQRLSLEFHEKYTSGRIIARQTSDLEALRELLDSGVSSLASGMLFMVFTAITVFALDWRSGLLVLAAGVPMFFLARWYQKHSQIAFRESRVVSARLIVHFVETMTGIRAVKAFRKEQENSGRYGQLAEDYRRVTVRSINLNGIFQPGLVLVGNVCVAVVLLFGGFRVLGGELEVGVLLALILSTKRFFQPVDQMAMFYNSFQSAQAALEKVSGLLEEVPTVRPPKSPVALKDAKGAIDFNGVEFRYGDGPVIVPTLDLHIPAGQTVALVGQTGRYGCPCARCRSADRTNREQRRATVDPATAPHGTVRHDMHAVAGRDGWTGPRVPSAVEVGATGNADPAAGVERRDEPGSGVGEDAVRRGDCGDWLAGFPDAPPDVCTGLTTVPSSSSAAKAHTSACWDVECFPAWSLPGRRRGRPRREGIGA